MLFFDTFIVQGVGDKSGQYKSFANEASLGAIRDAYPKYKWQNKIDVVKYTLASYADIAWDKVVIRFECEDINETESFLEFCRHLFPSAQIRNQRSATAKQYYDALSTLDVDDSAWVFFSPNNDHPYLAKPEKLIEYMQLVEHVSKEYPRNDIGFLFSHFTESMLDNRITDPQWGYFGFKFKKIISENNTAYITASNIAPLDSCQIFRLGYLKKIFSSTMNKGRVIRLEDTEFCSSPDHSVIQICPKIELCRHYDGYFHLMKAIPPLFIPPGFFESDIKLRYGYDEGKEGWINLNPKYKWISLDIDLPILLEDMPNFWKKRISAIDINPNFSIESDRAKLVFYRNFNNPWHNRSKALNLIRSMYIYILLQGWKFARSGLRSLAISAGIFGPLKKIKNKIFGIR
nr:hypothetical protein [uncultured Rhodoferax sp.]